MTHQPKTEGYREQFERETGRKDGYAEFEHPRYWRELSLWLESALAQSQKEAVELRDMLSQSPEIYQMPSGDWGFSICGVVSDGWVSSQMARHASRERQIREALASLTRKEQ